MNPEIDRLKQDLKTIEQAIGCEPDERELAYGRAAMWMNIGWGINGLIFILLHWLLHSLPFHMPTPLLALLGITLWLGLPAALTRLAGHSALQSVPPKFRGASSLSAILAILILGVMFWMSKLVIPPTLFPATMFLLSGSWFLCIAWGQPRWRGLWPWALGLMTLGFATPFLPNGTWGLAMAVTIAFSGFAGALVIHSQLKASAAYAKSAH